MSSVFSDGGMPEEDSAGPMGETTVPEQEQVSPLKDERSIYEGLARETQAEESDEGQLSADPELLLPPEARGETHGGPLGCCLGTIVGLFLTALLITATSIMLANGAFFGVATIPVLALGIILGGYFGWRIGKRIYREYESPVVKERQQAVRTKSRRRVSRSIYRT